MESVEEMKFLGSEGPDTLVDKKQSEDDEELDKENKERGHWANKAEFFLAIMGYTVGIGGIWRFPIVCSRNGGGAFLIPFFFFLLTCGGPLYYMEVCLGQFSGKSAGLAFEFCPLLKGLGFLQVALSFTVVWYLIFVSVWNYYYLYASFFPILPWTTCFNPWNTPFCKGLGFLQVMLSCTVVWYVVFISVWTYYYLYSSFFQTLPWTTCFNAWNTPFCKDYEANSTVFNSTSNYSMTENNVTSLITDEGKYRSPAFEFWENKVIGRSTGMGDIGTLQLHLVICMALAWILTALAVIKGAQTLGKVVYVTATAPYLFLTIMFIRGLTLDGAIDGVIAFLTPDFVKLFTIQTWLEAAIQVFYSLGPTWGGVITMASYNKFYQKSFWSSTLCVASSGFTSFYNGLVVFTILGFMAKTSGLPLDAVAKQSGPGLTFVAFPIALSKMPLPHLWSVLFFLMLVTVTFDSLFGMFETVSSGVIDLFPHHLTSKRVQVNVCVAIFFILTGLPLCLNNGIYIFQVSDWYFSQFALLIGSLFECIAVCWFYGTDRFSHDIALMTGREVSALLRIMWTLFIPVCVCATFFAMLSNYSSPDYGDGYVYDDGAIAYGIVVGLLPILGMIVIGVVTVWRAEGPLMQRLGQCSRPSKCWLPNDREARRAYQVIPYSYSGSLKHRILLDLRGTTKDNPVV